MNCLNPSLIMWPRQETANQMMVIKIVS